MHQSGMRSEPRLFDAAHIVVDANEELGQPIVSNGLPLTKLHHTAFDAHLIGIDDGPFLELVLEGDRRNTDRQTKTAPGSSRSGPAGASVRAIQESRIG